jgi:hypothetical protein
MVNRLKKLRQLLSSPSMEKSSVVQHDPAMLENQYRDYYKNIFVSPYADPSSMKRHVVGLREEWKNKIAPERMSEIELSVQAALKNKPIK